MGLPVWGVIFHLIDCCHFGGVGLRAQNFGSKRNRGRAVPRCLYVLGPFGVIRETRFNIEMIERLLPPAPVAFLSQSLLKRRVSAQATYAALRLLASLRQFSP